MGILLTDEEIWEASLISMESIAKAQLKKVMDEMRKPSRLLDNGQQMVIMFSYEDWQALLKEVE